ncbi:MAG TPA: circadian clock protein KaiC [Candidatus Binatia bacterium]|jgi:circadian clock protein KaiC|nr:circadian clock protein KaiC [Candidatus Binatia bacterium]
MTKTGSRFKQSNLGLAKSPTGIQGLDEVTGGGLPLGRPTLVCGGPGCGKTVLATEFLVRGATQYNEPGVFMGFEETAAELIKNVASLGFDLDELVAKKKLALDYVYVERSEIEETGEYDLEGLFVRLNHAINSIGAKRVVLDTIEALFAGLSNVAILRAELRRLFRWLKEKGVTAIVTGERGDGTLTRHGLEEYVSDCVIVLDHRVTEQVATRRLRIVKYRGSIHGTNEYPFLIEEHGICVVPITSIKLESTASAERISTGIPQLDAMLGGKGYYRGSTVLVSGTAGTGKTSVAAQFVDAACRRGERCLFFATEESSSQILRNMRSVGIDLEAWVSKGLLPFHCSRPTTLGLEMYLVTMYKFITEFKPHVVVLDPITDFEAAGTLVEAKDMLMRLVDFLKMRQTTTLFTSLTSGNGSAEVTEVRISSLIDTWLLLRNLEASGERNRGLYILKSRGMPHSNQIREFVLTDHRIELADVHLGPSGVLTGSARAAQEWQEKAAALARRHEIERKQSSLQYKRKALEARIAAQQAEFAAEAQELEATISLEEKLEKGRLHDHTEMAKQRGANSTKEAQE